MSAAAEGSKGQRGVGPLGGRCLGARGGGRCNFGGNRGRGPVTRDVAEGRNWVGGRFGWKHVGESPPGCVVSSGRVPSFANSG